jgi:hypothetical protein
VNNGPPPNAFEKWPPGKELPKTKAKHRVIQTGRCYLVEVKGWLLWRDAFGYLFSTPDEVCRAIERRDRQQDFAIVAESKDGN